MRDRKIEISVVFGLCLLLSSCESTSSFTTQPSSVSNSDPVGLLMGSYPTPSPSPSATVSSGGSNSGSYPVPSPSPSAISDPLPSPVPSVSPNPSSGSSSSGSYPAPSPSPSASVVSSGPGNSGNPSHGGGGYPNPSPSSTSGSGNYPAPSPTAGSSDSSGPFSGGEYCGYTQGGWGAVPHGGNPGAILAAAFPSVFPSGVEIGIAGNNGFSMEFDSASAITAYLPAGGTPAALDSDLVDPLSSSSGVFGGQVLALELNVALNQAGVVRGSAGNLGDLKLAGTGTSLDGMTVSAILQVAENVLGGGALPSGYSISGLNDVVTQFNQSFDACQPNSWAQAHLSP